MTDNDTVLIKRKFNEDEGKKEDRKKEPKFNPWPNINKDLKLDLCKGEKLLFQGQKVLTSKENSNVHGEITKWYAKSFNHVHPFCSAVYKTCTYERSKTLASI